MMGNRSVRQDLRLLPRTEDSWTFLYAEHKRVQQDSLGVTLTSSEGTVRVPVSQITTLLLGPGCSITSSALATLADHSCSVLWVGEDGVRFYASGGPKTNNADNLYRHARVWADPVTNQAVVTRMYEKRYGAAFPQHGTTAQLRGHEGVRVKQAYAEAAARHQLTWKGRNWVRDQWDVTDDLNRALSVAASCLYGLCHAAIVSVGLSPALGFIHVGDMRSFVLDVADMYRESIIIPIAFSAVANPPQGNLDSAVRRLCRESFKNSKLITRIVPDVYEVLGIGKAKGEMLNTTSAQILQQALEDNP